MPSARELLEQADALMRRNRARAVDNDIPELTEVVAEVGAEVVAEVVGKAGAEVVGKVGAEVVGKAGAEVVGIAGAEVVGKAGAEVVGKVGAEAAPGPGATLIAFDDVPELVDAVEEIEIASIVELPNHIDEVPEWLPGDPVVSSDTGRTFASGVAVLLEANLPEPAAEPVPPVSGVAPLPVANLPELPEPAAEPVPPAGPPPAIADDWARWEALAEEIRMQVLQRIDLFTDTRLRAQLGAQLQPIVDRASVQMVETINHEVGKLLRGYIAEAIEREIEKWRGTAG